ncbi:MAG: hypothetical protein HOE69_05660 [Euryarchaeota archaeon]|mgnify:FL=1|jgi:hypothetical protein|nr:hypothetical protein [Euryarchaeota archaeon]
MVDLNTAMQAARAEKRRKQREKGDKKSRPGGKLGIENFDPKDHVEKEKADAISMWLVLAFGTAIALLMRYVMMPGMEGPKSVLWFLPVTLVWIIPSLHKVIVPEPYKSRYTFGNWFRGGMLYIFTWLALSFILINPPIGDIGAPDIAGKMTVIIVDGEDVLIDNDNLTSSKGAFTLDLNGSTGEAWMLFSVNDNTDPNVAEISVTSKLNAPNESAIEMANGTVKDNAQCEEMWDGLRASQQNKITTHDYDVCVAINLGNLQAGDYHIVVTLVEQGDPWVNTRVIEYGLNVV